MVERRLKSDHASQEEVAYGRANDPDNVRSRKLPGQSDEWRKASINEAADYFFFSVLNETPSRIALRIRSGVGFMMRALSSRDFGALASSITRRSLA
jgi:hypothetical protein